MSLLVSSLPIARIPELPTPDSISPANGPGPGGDFRKLLGSAIGNVEKLRNDAAQSAQRFLAGDSEEIHSVALATQRAELALEVFVQVRNKVVSAYQSVMQMQV